MGTVKHKIADKYAELTELILVALASLSNPGFVTTRYLLDHSEEGKKIVNLLKEIGYGNSVTREVGKLLSSLCDSGYVVADRQSAFNHWMINSIYLSQYRPNVQQTKVLNTDPLVYTDPNENVVDVAEIRQGRTPLNLRIHTGYHEIGVLRISIIREGVKFDLPHFTYIVCITDTVDPKKARNAAIERGPVILEYYTPYEGDRTKAVRHQINVPSGQCVVLQSAE